MVVGHTFQKSGEILSRCNNTFFVIDVGISFIYGGNIAALEITENHIKGLYEDHEYIFSDL